jgi:hypothetical protein
MKVLAAFSPLQVNHPEVGIDILDLNPPQALHFKYYAEKTHPWLAAPLWKKFDFHQRCLAVE